MTGIGSRRRLVVVIGDALIDEVRSPAGTQRYPGGAGFNLAIGVATRGAPTALLTQMGADRDGNKLRAHLRACKVGLLEQPQSASTPVMMSDRSGGEPSYFASEAMLQRRIDVTPTVHAALTSAAMVAVNSVALQDDEQASALTRAFAGASGLRVVDPNPRPALITDPRRFRTNFDLLMAYADLVKVSAEDLEFLYGGADQSIVTRLLRGGARAVVLTRSAAGAEIHTAHGGVVIAPTAAVPGPVLDTMGAGDATLASLIVTMLGELGLGPWPRNLLSAAVDALDWRPHLQRAMVAAAATCRHRGAVVLPPDGTPPDISPTIGPVPRWPPRSVGR